MAEGNACRVCGTHIPYGESKCPLCGTEFVRSDGKMRAKVTVEKKAAKALDIDISNPQVRATLEELTTIPGVSRRGALVLYRQGVRSVSDFIKMAMPGEVRSQRYANVIANRLAMESMKMEKKPQERMFPCPSCRSPVKEGVTTCGVCGAKVSIEEDDANISDVRDRLNDKVKELFGEFANSEEFSALPDDMKAEITATLTNEKDMSEDEAKRVASTMTSLPTELSEIVDDMVMSDEHNDAEAKDDGSAEKRCKVANGQGPPAIPDTKQLKKRQILTARIEKWRKMGYDVSELEGMVDGDFEAFKAKAKEVLSSKLKGKAAPSPALSKPLEGSAKGGGSNNGAPRIASSSGPSDRADKTKMGKKPTPAEREKFLKQIDVWRGRGFDVEGLAELLDTDIEEFKKRSMAMLRAQVKK